MKLSALSRVAALRPISWILITVIVALLPLLGLSIPATRQVQLVLISALLVSGLNLSLGWAGELNMGLPAMYAAGAYVAAYVAAHYINDIVVCIVLAAVAAAVVGVIAGAPGLRLGGWMLAVCTFFLVLLIPTVLQLIPIAILGGQSGFVGIPTPMLFGLPLDHNSFFMVVVVVTSIWFVVYRNAVKSPFGNSLLTLQHGAVLAPSLGMSRYGLKLTAYALASIPLGVAGAFFAFTDQYLSPDSFGLNLIIQVLAASIISGRRSIYAIFAGVAFIQFITAESSQFEQFGSVAFGAFLVIGGVALGGGLSGLGFRLLRRLRARQQARQPEREPKSKRVVEIPTLPGVDLRLESVTKSFGGVQAVRGVSFTARAGQITALIGPNGSGKTTTLNIINGFQKPSSGRVMLGENEISSQSAVYVARAGVARTFQTPAVPTDLSVIDVVASARIESHKSRLASIVFRSPGYRRRQSENRAAAMRWLDVLGIGGLAGESASALALGTRRMIELARALASEPVIVLLDEVASGLDHGEVVELAEVLRRVRNAGANIILVEHNFSLVRSLADHVVVLAEGTVLTEGTPAEIAKHPDVLLRFLGSGAGVSGTTVVEEKP